MLGIKFYKLKKNVYLEFLNKLFKDQHIYRQLICHSYTIFKMYGLVEIHKNNNPLRPVISIICSGTYHLAKIYQIFLLYSFSFSKHKKSNSNRNKININ